MGIISALSVILGLMLVSFIAGYLTTRERQRRDQQGTHRVRKTDAQGDESGGVPVRSWPWEGRKR